MKGTEWEMSEVIENGNEGEDYEFMKQSYQVESFHKSLNASIVPKSLRLGQLD